MDVLVRKKINDNAESEPKIGQCKPRKDEGKEIVLQ